MVKALIFDCFGVLVTESWIPFKKKYFGADSELYEKSTEISKRANQGLISHQDFIDGAAKLAGITSRQAEEFISQNAPNEELFAYIKDLKNEYKIGFLSNIAGNYLARMFNEEQLALFDVIELSYESGFIKPEAGAYKNMAVRMGVDASEAILIDDQERNISGAKDAGMGGIQFFDTDQLKVELKPLLEKA